MESKTSFNWRQWYIASLALGLIMLSLFYLGIRLFFFRLYGANYTESYAILLSVLPIAIFFPARALAENYLTIYHWNWSLILLNLTTNAIGIILLIVTHNYFSFTTVSGMYYLSTMIFYISIVTWLFWRATNTKSCSNNAPN